MSDRIKLNRQQGNTPLISNPLLANSPQSTKIDLDRSTSQPNFSHDLSRIAPFYQAKLTIDRSVDTAEPVVDKVAQQVMEMGDSSLQQETISSAEQNLQRKSVAALISESQHTSSNVVQRQDRDPDEVAATAKEDASIEAKAKSFLKQPRILDFDVHQVIWRLIQSHRLDTNSQLSGVRYEKTKKGVEIKLSGEKASTQGSIIAGDDAVQRIANGQSAQIVKELEAQIKKVDTTRGTIDYVFIMGTDNPKKKNPFYQEAKKFFKAEYPKAVMVEDVRNLEGINQRINDEGKPVANLYIVSHANQDGTLSFAINSADKSGSVDYQEIKEANAKGDVTKPQEDLVGFWTNVMIRGCNLGRSKEMLNEVKSAFGGKSEVSAPTHEQGYGNGTEFMAGPFYEEPGISKLTNNEAFKKIKAKPEYSFITDAQWKAMSKTLKREPRQTEQLMYKYTVDFESAADATPDAIKAAKEDALKSARDDSSRPDAYIFKIFKSQKVRQGKGVKLNILVENQRTEWILYHSKINKQGKGFHPSTGTKPWFGEAN
jgi:hypothetical protein